MRAITVALVLVAIYLCAQITRMEVADRRYVAPAIERFRDANKRFDTSIPGSPERRAIYDEMVADWKDEQCAIRRAATLLFMPTEECK